MTENNALRHLISTTADNLVSELYTDDKVQARVTSWEKSTPNPTRGEEYAYLMAESRDFSEELCYRVIASLADHGYLEKPEDKLQ